MRTVAVLAPHIMRILSRIDKGQPEEEVEVPKDTYLVKWPEGHYSISTGIFTKDNFIPDPKKHLLVDDSIANKIMEYVK